MNLSGMKHGDYVSPNVEVIQEEQVIKPCDQFQGSEFFWINGKLLKDTEVMSRVADSPELAEKVRSFMIERDTSSFNPDADEKALFNELNSQFISKQEALDFIDNRIAEIQSQKIEDPTVKKNEDPTVND